MGTKVAILLGAISIVALLALWVAYRTACTMRRMKAELMKLGKAHAIPMQGSTALDISRAVAHDLEKKERALDLSSIYTPIADENELTAVLQRISSLALKLLGGKCVEVSLVDEESGMFHAAVVLGQGTVFGPESESLTGDDADVFSEKIVFAGETLGMLRVLLREDVTATNATRTILRLLALQGSVAIVNARYTRELLRMKYESDETVRAKTGFLANLSHEIRGPLGIILNATDLVLEELCGPLSDDQRETLQMVRLNTSHLLDLMTDVLDYAKVAAGQVKPNPVPLPTESTLKELTAMVRAQADAKSHRIILKEVPQELLLLCDKRHFRQMLINMLTNAIKYTPSGGKIEVWAERVPGCRGKIFVRDSGIGISKENWPKVFAAFERVNDEYAQSQVGTGLGMSLTRKLAELNGGTIDFDSEVGSGTTFWLVLPANDQETQRVNKEKETLPSLRIGGETILILENEIAERDMLARYLGHVGYRVLECASVTEAEGVLQQENVRVVCVSENALAGVRGSPLEFVRRAENGHHISVIMLTTHAFHTDVERFLKAGVDRCVAKPVSLSDIAVMVAELAKSEKQ